MGIQIKELLSYLNKLGANVRNHMSTIEDKYVEQARRDFAANPSSPAAKTETPAPLGTPVTTHRVTGQEEDKPQVQKPVVTAGGLRPSATRQPDKTQVQPEKTTSAVQQRKVTSKTAAPPQISNHPNKPQSQQQPRPKPQTKQTNQPESSNRGANHSRSTESKTLNQRAATAAAKQETSGTAAADHNRNKAQHGTSAKSQQQNGHKEQRQASNRGAKSQPTAQKSRSQSHNNQTQPHSGAQRGDGNRNKAQSKLNQKDSNGRPQSPTRPAALQKPKGPSTNVKSVELPERMTVKDFAQLLELAAADIIKKLMGLGVMATINQEIDLDTMILIADEFGVEATAAPTEEEKLQVEEEEDDPASLVKRSPVVTIMGHVDHGKTSLLDVIRKTNVTAHEAGGITQHIGAYQVEIKDRKITFLDTPGHEAFTAMRARGAQVTDIAVLVVAADDGVMPQTVEAINHAKDANIPIIVAVNKIDKPNANVERVKQQLTEYGLIAEEWGGDTIFVPVSAKQRIGIENLLEMILLVADMKELKANPNRAAKGTIIEAELDRGRGPVATVLVQNGTLEMGDSIVAGTAFGKVRALINDKGKRVKKAGPSTPVSVIGFDELPQAGDTLNVISEERMARQLADRRMQFKRETELLQNQKITLNDLFNRIKEGTVKELKLIVKADVQGSVEAICQSLERLSNDEVKVKVIHGGVGAIGEGDVTFASAANAVIIGFNVRPDQNAKRIAEKDNVDIHLYRVIYDIIEDVQKAMEGMLEPEFKEVITGRVEVRVVYKVPKVGNIAGSYVLEGKINRNSEIRLLRDNIVIHEGKIESLKRFKDDVREVTAGFECGIGIANFNDIKEGDIIEAFEMEEIKRTV